MRHVTVKLGLVTGLVGALALGFSAPGTASDVAHPTVVSETAATFTPNLLSAAAGNPYALTVNQAGTQIIVGGNFNQVENSKRTVQYNRSNLFSFDATTGAVSTFAPTFDRQVWSVVGDGNSVFVGGEFTTVNGVARPYLAKLSLSTGQLDPTFNPTLTGGRVTDLELSHGLLFVSGAFGKKLVALDPNTGAASSYFKNVVVSGHLLYTTRTEVFRFDVSPEGQHLVGVGNFTSVSGATHYRMFMLDLGATAATLSPWYYQPLERDCHAHMTPVKQMYVHDVDFSPDSSYFVTAATGGFRLNGEGPGQMICDAAARFDTNVLNPTTPAWINYTGGDSLHSVITTGSAVYVQGHSRWLDNPDGVDFAGPGAVSRPGGGAIDPVTGKALPWNPNMPQQKGGYQMYANTQGVWFATDGERFNSKHREGIRLAPLP